MVSVAIEGDDRLDFQQRAIRVSPDMRLEMHIDTDEASPTPLVPITRRPCPPGRPAMNGETLQRIVEEMFLLSCSAVPGARRR